MNLDELKRLYEARSLEDDSCQQFCDAVALAFPALLALARDGERYRWLRNFERPKDFYSSSPDWQVSKAQGGFGEVYRKEHLDAAVDAAMKERT